MHHRVFSGAASSRNKDPGDSGDDVGGAASGGIMPSAEPPVPPPPGPPDAPEDIAPRRSRVKALSTVAIGSGHIAFYAATSTHAPRYEAVCEDDAHNLYGRCRLTRHPKKRPLGELSMFLSISHYFDGNREHCDELVIASYPQYERIQFREALMEAPNGHILASFERPQSVTEPIERSD